MKSPEIRACNGIVFLFYTKSEAEAIAPIRDECIKAGVIPVACNNPKNFRFVSAEMVSGANAGLIGNAALRCLGEFNAREKFVKLLQDALCLKDADSTQEAR